MEKRRYVCLGAILLCASCAREAMNPLDLAPTTPFATWTPLEGNQLISSKYCKTIVPPSFGEGKLALADLIDIALQNNPETKQTWAEARAAAAEYGQSLSTYSPQIDGQGTLTRERQYFTIGGPLYPYYLTVFGPAVNLTYTLFDFGERSGRAESARQSLLYADWNHNFQIQAVVQTIMDNYYTYTYAQMLQRAKETDLLNYSAILDAANQKFAMGLASLGDVAQARTQYLQAKIAVSNQKQEVENTFATLATHLGLPANIPFKVEPLPTEVTPGALMDDLDQLVALAQANRPDLSAAAANLCSKQAELQVARAKLFPVLSGSFNLGRFNYNQGLHERYHFTAELSLDFPIFRGFYLQNGIRKAKANLEASKAEYLQTELNVLRDVTTAHIGVQTAASNLADASDYLAAAELQYKIALESYQAGTNTILDLLSAQSSLADARAKRAGAIRNWFVSLASLAFSTGSLCGRGCES